jgi:hypothetical protein
MIVSKKPYVIQPNVISRAIYIMPVMARRLIFFAILHVQTTKPADMRFSCDLYTLAIQFGFNKTKRYNQLKAAITSASSQVLRYEQENGDITEWIPWLTYCKLDLKTKILTIQINEYLYDYVLNISSHFSILLFSDYLKLESRYAYRWFEIIFSRSGHADKDGKFFVQYNTDEIKKMFVLDKKKYKETNDFREYVIDNPIAEINEKKIGFHIMPEYQYTRNKLLTVILRCAFAKREDGDEPIPYFISHYPKEYFRCYQAAKKLLPAGEFRSGDAYEMECTKKALELLMKRLNKNE